MKRDRRDFVLGSVTAGLCAGLSVMLGLVRGNSGNASPAPFVDARRGSGILGQENKRVCEWISYAARKPKAKEKVSLCFMDGPQVIRTVAIYIPYREVPWEDWINPEFDEFHDIDEESGECWAPEGFYEYRSQDECSLHVDGDFENRHFFWMSYPDVPAELKPPVA